jgi:hypothetical protein
VDRNDSSSRARDIVCAAKVEEISVVVTFSVLLSTVLIEGEESAKTICGLYSSVIS